MWEIVHEIGIRLDKHTADWTMLRQHSSRRAISLDRVMVVGSSQSSSNWPSIGERALLQVTAVASLFIFANYANSIKASCTKHKSSTIAVAPVCWCVYCCNVMNENRIGCRRIVLPHNIQMKSEFREILSHMRSKHRNVWKYHYTYQNDSEILSFQLASARGEATKQEM